MFLYDDGFMVEFRDSYALYIAGRLGSGKTLLALEIAERFLQRGYKLYSQMSTIWNDDVDTMVADDTGQRKVVCIIDEGGLYFRTARSASRVSSFNRKQHIYVIFAGAKAPHEDLCNLTVQLWFDFYKMFLIPLKVWRYDRVNGRKSYHGYVWQTGWWEWYGVYNTLDPGGFPDDVAGTFTRWTDELFGRYGRRYRLSDVETSRGDDQVEVSNELAASVRRMDDIRESLASMAQHKKWWRR